MAKVGVFVQFAGVAIAAATLLLMWKWHSPEPGRIAGVSSGPDASPWFVILAVGLVAMALASIRWSLAAAALAGVAVSTIAYGLISHRLVDAGPIPIGLSAGATAAGGASLAIAGLWIRAATLIAGPRVGRQLGLTVAGIAVAVFLVWLAFVIWARFQPPAVPEPPLVPPYR
jgi:hypothetical protein